MADKTCDNCGVELKFSNTSLNNNNLCEECDKKIGNIQATQVIKDPIIEQNQKWNKLSLLATAVVLVEIGIFVFGALFDLTMPIPLAIWFYIAPLVALLLALISHRQIKKTQEKGKSLSKIILILLGVPLILLMLFFLMMIFYYATGGTGPM